MRRKSGAYCNTGSAGANAIDILNEHIKPGIVSDDVEAETKTEYHGLYDVLKATEQSKPYWNGEAGYGLSWPSPQNDDLLAAFVGRYMLTEWSLGIQSVNWYTWTIGNLLSPNSSKAAVAWQQMYNSTAEGSGPENGRADDRTDRHIPNSR